MPFKGVPFLLPFIREYPFTQLHEILSQNTTDARLSYGENQKSLSHLVLERYRAVTPGQTNRRTDGQTDRIIIANTHYS